MEKQDSKDPKDENHETATRLKVEYRTKDGQTLQDFLKNAPKGTTIKINGKVFTI
ncbi:hypothetical protein JCM14469_26630 [Desulfatiferula olefinivorans]